MYLLIIHKPKYNEDLNYGPLQNQWNDSDYRLERLFSGGFLILDLFYDELLTLQRKSTYFLGHEPELNEALVVITFLRFSFPLLAYSA